MCRKQDSPEHVFYECERWNREREKVLRHMNELPRPPEIIPRMIEKKEVYDLLYDFVVEIMKRKGKEDRRRQGLITLSLLVFVLFSWVSFIV